MSEFDLDKEARQYAGSRYWDRANVPVERLEKDLKCGAEDFVAGFHKGQQVLAKRVLGELRSERLEALAIEGVKIKGTPLNLTEAYLAGASDISRHVKFIINKLLSPRPDLYPKAVTEDELAKKWDGE